MIRQYLSSRRAIVAGAVATAGVAAVLFIGPVADSPLSVISARSGEVVVPVAHHMRVDLTEACRQQWDRPTAEARRSRDGQVRNTYYCLEYHRALSLGFPSGVVLTYTEAVLGGLDIQQYCDRNAHGSRAVGNFDANYTWDCVE